MENFITDKKPKNILLGITGCISAYKMCHCIREFIKNNHKVKVILSPCATKFVTETTISVLSQNKVYCDIFEPENGWFPQHIDLANWADVFLIAPLSAEMLSKIVGGAANTLLLCTLLAYKNKVLFAPSMNDQMYQNEMVQKNLEQLMSIPRYKILDPDSGFLACLANGYGRLPDVNKICKEVENL